MEIDLILKNYRCFPDSNPARLSIRTGFTGLVGVNNSGKSSLLRFLYEFRSLWQQTALQSGELVEAIRGNRRAFRLPPQIQDVEELFSRGIDRNIEIDLSVEILVRKQPRRAHFIITVPRSTSDWQGKLNIYGVEASAEALITAIDVLRRGLQTEIDLSGFFDATKALTDVLYIGPFRNAINMGANQNYFDIQTGQAFVQAWRRYKTGPVVRENEAADRLTKDIQRLFDLDDLEINASEDSQTVRLLVNGRSFKLEEIGAGLTQFILVLANAAVRQPSFILIDEPELNLHPSLQLDFLTTLGSYAREGVIFSTHSIGLARATAERIYLLRKIKEGESDVTVYEATPRLAEFLGELGYSGQREVGYDKVLLVEGSTDVLTIQQFLRKYKKDHRVVLLQLGGSNMINGARGSELEEIKRISPNVETIIDSERDRQGSSLGAEREDFVTACNQAGIRCHVLDRRAIENYMSDRAVKKVKGKKYRALEPYERLQDVSSAWAKAEGWRIALEMTREELDGTDLGGILASL